MAEITDCFYDGSSGYSITGADNVATIYCLVPLIQNVIVALVSLSGVVLFIVLITSGFSFLTAGGDQKKLEKAKGGISAAITGLVIITVAYLILALIESFTGVDVTEFRIFHE